MTMEILRILDELEVMLRGSRKVPFTNGTIVDNNRFLDRLDRIRAILPEDIMTAKLLINEKDRIVNDAYEEAQKYVEKSKDTVARMVDEEKSVVILKNNKPKYMIIDLTNNPIIDLSDEEKISIVAKRVLEKYKPAFKELAK